MRLINFMGIVRRTIIGDVPAARLFSNDEPGLWLDPSDLGTMWQDVAGTSPVTATGQLVARIDDKSGNGNHATQSTEANRPRYGIVPEGGRRNLLTRTEEFDNAVWNKTISGVVVAQATDGFQSVERITSSITASLSYSGMPTANDQTYTYCFEILAGTENRISFGLNRGGWGETINSQATVVSGPGAIVRAVGALFNATGLSATEVTKVLVSRTTKAGDGSATMAAFIYPVSSGSTSPTGSVLIRRPQLELGSTATAYQRVTDQYNVTEAGVASKAYLQFDGSNDSLATGTITPGTDKAQVFAGVRKLSDATRGVVAEMSASIASNNGAINLTAPNAASATFAFESKGTILTDAVDTGIAAPADRVLAGLGDISGDRARLRIDGVQEALNIDDQGTGNYLAYPLYIGARAGTSLFFNGQLFSLVTRFGPNLTAAELERSERYVASKTAGASI